MFFNFGFGEQYDVVIEQYVGNALVAQNHLSGPQEMLIMQFMSMVRHSGNQRQPMKIVMKRPIDIWDKFDQKTRVVWVEVECKNWRDD